MASYCGRHHEYPFRALLLIRRQASACSMPDCKGVNTSTTMAGFTEDFGVTTVPIELSPTRGTTQFTGNTAGTLNPNEYCFYSTTAGLSPDWITTGDSNT